MTGLLGKARGLSSNRARVRRLSHKRKAHLVEALVSAHACFGELQGAVIRRFREAQRTGLPPSLERLFVQGGGPVSLRSNYHRRYHRTIDLTVRTIEHLRKNRVRVSLRAVERVSRLVDPTGRGISRRTVLLNPDAYDEYRRAAAWPYRSQAKTTAPVPEGDRSDIRERIGRLGKFELACAIVELLNLNHEMETTIMQANLLALKSTAALF